MNSSTVHAPGKHLDWHAVKGDVSIEAVAVALLGEPPGRNGRGLWWRCPFHDDRNPSLLVSREKGRWRCFGCGEHGDAAELVMRSEGLTFPEAVRRTAELCGSGVVGPSLQGPHRPPPKAPERPPAGPSGLPREEAERVVFEAAERLWTSEGVNALSYLHGRGLEDETIRSARLGFVPRVAVPTRNGDRTFQASGIVVPWLDGGRPRLVKVRRLDDGKPKYAEAFRDSPTVFPSMEAIRPGLPLAIAEGEFDALLLHRLIGDFVCVVTVGSASSGIGRDVLDAALRCDPWYAAQDADDAGEKAGAKWLNFPWAVRVKPPAPAKDWTEAHALGFNVVRNLWLGVVRSAPRPSWEDLEAERWGPALEGDALHADSEPKGEDL